MFASHIPRYVSFKVIWREGMRDSDSLFLGLLNVNIKLEMKSKISVIGSCFKGRLSTNYL